MIREILRMGDPRLLERSREVERFGTRELQELLADMRDTMRAAMGGTGREWNAYEPRVTMTVPTWVGEERV